MALLRSVGIALPLWRVGSPDGFLRGCLEESFRKTFLVQPRREMATSSIVEGAVGELRSHDSSFDPQLVKTHPGAFLARLVEAKLLLAAQACAKDLDPLDNDALAEYAAALIKAGKLWEAAKLLGKPSVLDHLTLNLAMCALVTSRDDAHFLDVCKAIHRAKNLTDDDRRVLFMVAIQHAPSAELALAAYETGRDSVTASPDELRHVLLLRALLIKSSNDRPIARAAAWDFLKTPLTEEAFFDVTSKLIRLTSPKEMDAFMAEAESVSTAWGRLLRVWRIERLGQRGVVQQMEEMFESAVAQQTVDVDTLCAAAAGLRDNGKAQQALALLNRAEEFGIQGSVDVWNLRLSLLQDGGDADAATSADYLLAQMEEAGVVGDATTTVIYAGILRKAKRLESVMKLVQDVRAERRTVDAELYHEAIATAVDMEALDIAQNLLREAGRDGVAPAPDTINLIAKLLREKMLYAQEESLLSEFAGSGPSDPRIGHTLVLSALDRRQVSRAESIVKRMGDAGMALLPETFTQLIRHYDGMRQPQKGLAVYDLATQAGTTLDARSYVTLMTAASRVGDVQLLEDLFADMERAGVQHTPASIGAFVHAAKRARAFYLVPRAWQVAQRHNVPLDDALIEAMQYSMLKHATADEMYHFTKATERVQLLRQFESAWRGVERSRTQ